jgi:CDP-glycerol glycerophosphotransferase (TagB/SpsB family)
MKQNHNRQKPTIFFASTFSPKYTKARILYPWVKKMIEKYDYRWYITLHPKMSKDVVDDYRSLESDKVKFLKPTQIYDGFVDSDLMLCDTSSIVFEYLTQLKPVVTFQYNNPRSVLINVEKLEDLEDTINKTLKNNPKKPEELMECVNQYHPYYDGKSSYRVLQIVDEMLKGKYKPKKKKPLNIIRNLKLRKELNYWKFF